MRSHSLLRKLMMKEKDFLYHLYKETSGRRNRYNIKTASPQQVWLVLRILFCIAAGHIPLTYKNYQRLSWSKRKNSLRSLKNRMRYLKKKSSEGRRRKFILQFAVLYQFLFHDLFEQDNLE